MQFNKRMLIDIDFGMGIIPEVSLHGRQDTHFPLVVVQGPVATEWLHVVCINQRACVLIEETLNCKTFIISLILAYSLHLSFRPACFFNDFDGDCQNIFRTWNKNCSVGTWVLFHWHEDF